MMIVQQVEIHSELALTKTDPSHHARDQRQQQLTCICMMMCAFLSTVQILSHLSPIPHLAVEAGPIAASSFCKF